MADSGPDLESGDIDSIVEEANEQAGVTDAQTAAPEETRTASETEELLDQAEADLEQAMADVAVGVGESEATEAATGLDLKDLADRGGPVTLLPIESLQDVELNLRIELGRTNLLIQDVMKLTEGSVVQLDKLAGDPVDILVNERLVARGEILVLNDNFCVRVVEILTPDV